MVRRSHSQGLQKTASKTTWIAIQTSSSGPKSWSQLRIRPRYA